MQQILVCSPEEAVLKLPEKLQRQLPPCHACSWASGAAALSEKESTLSGDLGFLCGKLQEHVESPQLPSCPLLSCPDLQRAPLQHAEPYWWMLLSLRV